MGMKVLRMLRPGGNQDRGRGVSDVRVIMWVIPRVVWRLVISDADRGVDMAARWKGISQEKKRGRVVGG